MRFSDAIELVAVIYGQDELMQQTVTDGKPRPVYCNLFTIGRGEFEAAAQQGLKPDSAYQLNTIDYHGEVKAKVNGRTLHVYRTTVNGDRTTIYLTEAISDGKR